MHRLIGIDTGGTYTDAVLFDETRGVLAKAKALTTRQDLAIGIGQAIDAVLSQGGVEPPDIGMVSMSSTLATNAIVEGQGGRVCLVMIGFAERDLVRAGLARALEDSAVVLLDGGHDAFGDELARLDLDPLDAWLAEAPGSVEAFAVAGHFSVANPDHEDRVRSHLEATTGRPVTCSHDLTAKLNGPKRALTCVLNARLIGIIHHLIDAAEALLAARGIGAPLMIVKGDGSLISVGEARRKPIETILSGPAASIVGAAFLTGIADGLVSDIGGTTTDVGLIRAGRPRLDPEGASVGGHSTFVEAVAMRTFGLGADSEVRVLAEGGVLLGPRRVVPVSLLAMTHAAVVHAALDRHLEQPVPADLAGRFAVATGRRGGSDRARSEADRECLDLLREGPAPLDRLVASYRRRSALTRLVTEGLVAIAAFSPSDAAHVLHLHRAWDRGAAAKAASLFARQRGRGGAAIAANGDVMSRIVFDALIRTSAERLLDVALAEDGFGMERPSDHPILQAALDRSSGLTEITARLALPVIGLGASAAVYYPPVGRILSAEIVVPEHADVANAVGAVVGRVRVEVLVMVGRPDDGLYRVLGGPAPRDFLVEAEALACAEALCRDLAIALAGQNGVIDADVGVSSEAISAAVGGRDLVLEWRFTGVATGRPRLG